MNQMQDRITASFNSQGLMATLGAQLVFVADGEVHIALPFSKQLSQQHGYVHAGAKSISCDLRSANGSWQSERCKTRESS
jgi:acyl-coenzyme A thioesterase PaaI-like protein